MFKLSKFIVEKKFLFFFLFLVAMILSFYAMRQVNVNYDLTKYLPDDSETKLAIDIMEEEFGLNGVTNVVVADVTVEEAIRLRDDISQIDGVLNVLFENNDQFYKEGHALFKITLVEGDYSLITEQAVYAVKDTLQDYEVEMTGSSVYNIEQKEDVLREMTMILAIAVPIIIIILFISANSYAEILVFGIVVGAAVLLNKGTNIFLGEISYVTDSVAIVLQLALAMDYSIILLHRFEEEKKNYPPKEAIIHALKNSVTSISASSLTTIFGLVSIMFMKFTIGFDIGIVLAKSIVCSLISVFLLMPGVLLVFNKVIVKTTHKKFIPDFHFIHKYVIKTRFFMPVVMVVLIALAFTVQRENTFLFSLNNTEESQYTKLFGKTNTLAIIVPKGNREAEKNVIAYIKENPYVNSASGIETLGLREALRPEEFAATFGMEQSLSYGLYGYYMEHMGQSLPEIKLDSMLTFMVNNQSLLRLTDEQIQNISQMNTLITLKNQSLDYVELASVLGIEETQAKMMVIMYEMSLDQKTYKFIDVLSFMVTHANELGINGDELEALQQSKQLIDIQNTNLSYMELASFLGMTNTESYMIYTIYEMSLDQQKYGLTNILEYMVNNKTVLGIPETEVLELEGALQLVSYKQVPLGEEGFAQMMGMRLEDVSLLYQAYKMEHQTNNSEIEFGTMIDYLTQNHNNLGLSELETQQVLKVNALLNNIPLSVSEFHQILQMPTSQALGIFGSYASTNGYMVSPNKTKDILSFMSEHSNVLQLDEETSNQINTIVNIYAVSYQDINVSQFAAALQMESQNVLGIFTAYAASNGYVTIPIAFNTLLPFILSKPELIPLEYTSKLNQVKTLLEASDQNLNVSTFSQLLQLEVTHVKTLYGVYTAKTNTPTIKLIDLINFMAINSESLGLSADQKTQIIESQALINTAINQFESDEYARIVFNIDLSQDNEEALEIIRDLRTNLSHYYDEYYVLGDSANILDIKDSFNEDVLLVNMISIVSIFIILAFSFKSIIVPILLILVIQGSIWINFSFSSLTDKPVIFMGYIMVTAIQMGATIDYAIVMTERYKGFRESLNKLESIKNAIRVSIPTLLTSGGILIVAGFSIGLISSITTIKDLGILMGRGALISAILVLFLLPQFLLIFDRIVYKRKKVN